jgi:hypothetical protein
LICMYDVIYEAEIALCNINKQPLQLIFFLLFSTQSPSLDQMRSFIV